MDRDEKKLDVFLGFHKKTLTVANLKIFLPFTINLDPFIKKVIKEEVQNLEELGLTVLNTPAAAAVVTPGTANPPLTRRQAVGLSKKMTGPNQEQFQPGLLPPYMGMGGSIGVPYPYPSLAYPPGQQQFYPHPPQPVNRSLPSKLERSSLPVDLRGKALSSFTVEQVSDSPAIQLAHKLILYKAV